MNNSSFKNSSGPKSSGQKSLFTSESVCSGHPDKICDQISDAILDQALSNDPEAHVAVETMVTKNKVIIVGEVSTNTNIDYEGIARREIRRLGYIDNSNFSDKSDVEVYISEQSLEIKKGVNNDGAGDQGMMFGYACRETKEYMPLPIMIAHNLAESIDKARENKKLSYLYPDGKTQVSVEYKDGKPYRVNNIVIAVPHSRDIDIYKVKDDIYNLIIKEVLDRYGFSVDKNDVILNGTGVWHQGGPSSDAGLTGRKIIVDTYGGYARVGGGCFSGKDTTKVDRSGAYAARFIAKNIVANNLADKAEVRLAYVIGKPQPLMKEVETFGTSKKSDKEIKDYIDSIIDTSVLGIINCFNLKRPIYLKTAAYGHFGREIFPWEKIV